MNPKNSDFWTFPRVLEGLKSSGKLVGFISTYPGTSPTSWCRVLAKKPPGAGLQTCPGKNAYEKFLAGANYLQLYTGMVFRGPNIVHMIKKELKELLIVDGVKNFAEIVGKK